MDNEGIILKSWVLTSVGGLFIVNRLCYLIYEHYSITFHKIKYKST